MPDELGVPGRGRHVAAARLQARRVRHLPGRLLGGAGGQVTTLLIELATNPREASTVPGEFPFWGLFLIESTY